MPERSVFISKSTYPYFEEVRVAIDWFGGFAMSQKRKYQIGLHQNLLAKYPDRKVLEISSAAIFVGMVKAGKIDEVRDYHSYLALFRTREDGRPTGPESYEKVQLLQKKNVMLFLPVVPYLSQGGCGEILPRKLFHADE